MKTEDGRSEAVIVTYEPRWRCVFESLNVAWLEQYSLLEGHDLQYLRDPDTFIIRPGGQVFFALENDEPVGTCAAIRRSSETFELAKLAVTPEARRRGLGRRLSQAVILFARESGAAQVVLVSNTALQEAIRLYESMGFRHSAMPREVTYRTANVYMRLAV